MQQKNLESKRQQSGEEQYRDTQIRVLVSLGDAYVVISVAHINKSFNIEHHEYRYAFRVLKEKAGESVVQGGSRICHLMLSSSTSTRNTIRKVSTCTHGIGKSFRTSL